MGLAPALWSAQTCSWSPFGVSRPDFCLPSSNRCQWEPVLLHSPGTPGARFFDGPCLIDEETAFQRSQDSCQGSCTRRGNGELAWKPSFENFKGCIFSFPPRYPALNIVIICYLQTLSVREPKKNLELLQNGNASLSTILLASLLPASCLAPSLPCSLPPVSSTSLPFI